MNSIALRKAFGMPTELGIFFHGRGLGPESAGDVASAFPETTFLAPAGGVELRRGRTWLQAALTLP
jgi:hypothetical protein